MTCVSTSTLALRDQGTRGRYRDWPPKVKDTYGPHGAKRFAARGFRDDVAIHNRQVMRWGTRAPCGPANPEPTLWWAYMRLS